MSVSPCSARPRHSASARAATSAAVRASPARSAAAPRRAGPRRRARRRSHSRARSRCATRRSTPARAPRAAARRDAGWRYGARRAGRAPQGVDQCVERHGRPRRSASSARSASRLEPPVPAGRPSTGTRQVPRSRISSPFCVFAMRQRSPMRGGVSSPRAPKVGSGSLQSDRRRSASRIHRVAAASAAAMRARLPAVSSSKTICSAAAIGTPMMAPITPNSAPNDKDADDHGEAGDPRCPPDDRRLQDVVLDLLVDDDHDHEGDQRPEADRERDDADDDPRQRAPMLGMRSRIPAITARASGYGSPRITAVMP